MATIYKITNKLNNSCSVIAALNKIEIENNFIIPHNNGIQLKYAHQNFFYNFEKFLQ